MGSRLIPMSIFVFLWLKTNTSEQIVIIEDRNECLWRHEYRSEIFGTCASSFDNKRNASRRFGIVFDITNGYKVKRNVIELEKFFYCKFWLIGQWYWVNVKTMMIRVTVLQNGRLWRHTLGANIRKVLGYWK